ncbi:MAG: hypothetical protein V8R14_01590 [Clostridia bacterium]
MSASSEDVERRHSPSAFGDSSPEDERSGGTLHQEDAEHRHGASVFGDSSPEDERSGENSSSKDVERRHSASVFGDLGARGSFTELITALKARFLTWLQLCETTRPTACSTEAGSK